MLKNIRFVILISLLFFINAFSQTKEYSGRINNQFVIEMILPDGYQTVSDNRLNKTFTLKEEGDDNFVFMISPIVGAHENYTSIKYVKKQVIQNGEKLLNKSVERKLVLHEIISDKTIGYYYQLTDKKPKKGEHKYLFQGIITGNKSRIAFTLLCHKENKDLVGIMVDVLKSISIKCEENPNSYFKDIKILKADLKNASIGHELLYKTIQIVTYYDSPDIYEQMLPKLIERDYQSVETKEEKGSILYFKYDGNIESKRGFLEGLFYGNDDTPSYEHPEEIFFKKDLMIVFCFQLESKLKDTLKTIIIERLK